MSKVAGFTTKEMIYDKKVMSKNNTRENSTRGIQMTIEIKI